MNPNRVDELRRLASNAGMEWVEWQRSHPNDISARFPAIATWTKIHPRELADLCDEAADWRERALRNAHWQERALLAETMLADLRTVAAATGGRAAAPDEVTTTMRSIP